MPTVHVTGPTAGSRHDAPSGHGLHALDPVRSAYDPGAHVVHDVCPDAEYVPAEHATGNDDGDAQYAPAGHTWRGGRGGDGLASTARGAAQRQCSARPATLT